MAIRLLTHTSRRRVFSAGYPRFQPIPPSRRIVTPPNGTGPISGQNCALEKLWQDFFVDPSEWWDYRSDKRNPKYPDFKHKKTEKALWLNGKLNPPWVEAKLATMEPGAVPSTIFSWNSRLARCVKIGHYEETLRLFHNMQREGIHPDRFTFVPLLNACAGLQALQEGIWIHKQITGSCLESNIYIGSSLIDMYAKCGSMDDAWKVFHKMPTRNIVSWNAIILGYVRWGQGQRAIQLYQDMQEQNLKPDHVTFVGVLNACASLTALDEGRAVHAQVIQSGSESDVFVGSSLVDMYCKCGSIEDALSVFNKIPAPDVVAWNAMILGHVKCGQEHKALELSRKMQQERIKPDSITFMGLLNACAHGRMIDEGRRVHKQIILHGYDSDVFVGNSLVDMYANCGSTEEAWRAFKCMRTRDLASWNVMILGFLKCGQLHRALGLLGSMQSEGLEPNDVTFVGLLNACGSLSALEEGRHLHGQSIARGLEADIYVGSSLISMYAKCGIMEDAWGVFNKMPARDVVSWNALIQGLVKDGQGQKALKLLQEMEHEGVEPDLVTFVGLLNACASVGALEEGRRVHGLIIQRVSKFDIFLGNSLVDMYAKCGSIDDAWSVFNEMPTHDVVSWNAMILGLVKCNRVQEALELSRDMLQRGLEPDPVTFVGYLNACANAMALEEGRQVHEKIIARGLESDVFVGSSLIDMYGKCGSIEDALSVLNKMPVRSVVSCNAMLGGYAMHGHSKEALGFFERMCQEGVKITTVTLVSLLSACSHVGLVDEGLHHFGSMGAKYNICRTVEHYACMVDILGRAGRLHEAEGLISTMSYKPDVTVWMSLLGNCRLHGNVEMGEHIGKQVIELDPEFSAGYVLLSNIYAAAAECSSAGPQ